MASNTKCSSSPTPIPSPPPPPGLAFPPADTHRSSCLTPEMKLYYEQVFTELPQEPHFNPLESFKGKCLKEGIKLGCDIALLHLVHKLQNLSDPFTVLSEEESYTQEVEELEEVGYDLTKIKERFNLLKGKAEEKREFRDEVERLEKEKKLIEEKIGSHEFCLMELAEETARVEEEVKRERSEVDSIVEEQRKIMDDSAMKVSEFENLTKFQ